MNDVQSQSSLALVGLSGSGKSTLAQMLAAQLSWPLHDIDAMIVAQTRQTAAELFATQGEHVFRDIECQLLRDVLLGESCVVATGGGIILREQNRRILRERASVVWLDAPTDILIARLLAHDEERPLVAGENPAARLRALRAAREAFYAEVADIRINTGAHSVDALVDHIIQWFTQETHVP